MNYNNPICTVIIPVYNGEKYVSNMIENVISQTFKDWELIIVNDGSTDSTENILVKYRDNDERISFITQKNMGSGSARITGILSAKGKYTCLVDADDKMTDDYLEKFVNAIEDSQADMVWCDVYGIYNGKTFVEQHKFEENIDKVISRQMLGSLLSSVWNRIYKTDILCKVTPYFKGLSQNEDAVTNIAYLLHSKKIKYIPYPLYYYNMDNQDSLCHTVTKRKTVNEYIGVCKSLDSALRDAGRYNDFEYELNYRKLWAIRDFIDNKLTVDYKRFINTFPEAIENIWNYDDYPLRLKISAVLIKHGLALFIPIVCKIDSLSRHFLKLLKINRG